MKNKSLRRTIEKVFFLPGLILCICALMLCGCSKDAVVEGKNQQGYSLSEIMIIAMAEKNRYEEVCTDQIWGVEISEEGSNFASYLTEQIKSFMDEMKIMCLLAAEKNVTLSPEESAAMANASEEYYGKLTKNDIAQMGVTKEDVVRVFEDYCLANKLVEELTKDVNLEVSDSEAKVIEVLQAKVDSREAADSLLLAASQEKADFTRCAESVGATVTTRQLGRAEESKRFEDAAFSLLMDEMSEVIEDGEAFYVLKCLDDYDEEATKIRKETIFKERKRKAFEEIYVDFKEGINLTYTGEPWENLKLTGEAFAKEADFFEIYGAYEK